MVNCATLYNHNLENRNLLFLFGIPQFPEYLETVFLARHFLHLTGVKLCPDRVRSSTDFYGRCLNGRLSPSDFFIPESGTTEMKLSVLPQLMQINKFAKMIGNYDFNKSVLSTDKLAGNVSACMGFVRVDGFYVPNTALREDIRDVTRHPQKRILAIYRKTLREQKYIEVCYTAKGIDLEKLSMPEEIREKIGNTERKAVIRVVGLHQVPISG